MLENSAIWNYINKERRTHLHIKLILFIIFVLFGHIQSCHFQSCFQSKMNVKRNIDLLTNHTKNVSVINYVSFSFIARFCLEIFRHNLSKCSFTCCWFLCLLDFRNFLTKFKTWKFRDLLDNLSYNNDAFFEILERRKFCKLKESPTCEFHAGVLHI